MAEVFLCSSLPLGGYDCLFVETPCKYFECPICLLTLRAPHLLSCCGVKICQSCIEGVQKKNGPCPKCRKLDFVTLLDKELERTIFDLLVECSLKHSGCTWSGELRYLERHLSSSSEGECLYVEIGCSHGCGKKMIRKDMEAHEKQECPNLPMATQLENLKIKMEKTITEFHNQHQVEMSILEAKIAEQDKIISVLREDLCKLQTEKEQYSITIPVFSSTVLLIMPKIANGNIPGISYYPFDQFVKITGNSQEEMEARTQQFFAEYEMILSNLHKDNFKVVPHYPQHIVQSLVSNCNKAFKLCYALFRGSVVQLISTDDSQHQQASKYIAEGLDKKILEFKFPGTAQCTLTLKVCRIVDETVDTVIAPMENVQENSGGLISALFTKKFSVQETLVSSTDAKEPFQPLMSISEGKYKSKYIIYIPDESINTLQKEQLDTLSEFIYNALAKSLSCQAKSVAIPVESSGKGNALKSSFAVPSVIHSVEKLWNEYETKGSDWTLKDVRIVIQDDLSSFDNGWFYSYAQYIATKYSLK